MYLKKEPLMVARLFREGRTVRVFPLDSSRPESSVYPRQIEAMFPLIGTQHLYKPERARAVLARA